MANGSRGNGGSHVNCHEIVVHGIAQLAFFGKVLMGS